MTTGNPRTNPTPKKKCPKRRSSNRGQEFTNMICEVEGRERFITSPRRRSLISDTVDGRNPTSQLVGGLSQYLPSFCTSQVGGAGFPAASTASTSSSPRTFQNPRSGKYVQYIFKRLEQCQICMKPGEFKKR